MVYDRAMDSALEDIWDGALEVRNQRMYCIGEYIGRCIGGTESEVRNRRILYIEIVSQRRIQNCVNA